MDNVDPIFHSILTGFSPFRPDALTDAVADRALGLLPYTAKVAEFQGPTCYGGNRTKAENLGWRFAQRFGEWDPALIRAGLADAEILYAYHEAASAEHYYRYEKDWGEDY